MLIIYALLLIAAVGLAAKYALPKMFPNGDGAGYYTVNWTEYALGVVVMTILFAVIINPVGTNLARNNSLKYKEFWNGYETAAQHQRIPCHRDGPCVHEYNCDPYNHVHHHTRTVGSGSNQRTEHYTTDHTHYHSCPYSTEEWTFVVDTTLGVYTVLAHGFPDNPHEWRGGHGIPGNVFRGIPPFWQAAKDRIDSGDPGPVTAIKDYDNYVLASQHTILKKWSSSIEKYRARNLLPNPASNIKSLYYADKAYFMGVRPKDQGAWQWHVNKLNAALGIDLQGDLHFIAVNTDTVTDPDEYSQALFAHWQSPKLGRKAASKNTIIVVVGTNGKTIEWARADTGMPLGNEQLMVDIRNELKGVEFTPEKVFGAPIGKIVNGAATIRHSDGALDKALWGTNKFERVCMTCKDDEGKTGFTYLKGQIPLKGGQKTMILFVTFFVSFIVWAIMGAVDLKIPDVISINLPKLKRGTGNNV